MTGVQTCALPISQLQQDQIDLNNKTAQLAKETVTSPIDGVIVTMNFNNGDTVQSGKPIATVIDMKSLQIVAQVDELDISKVANGQKATITFDALTGKTYTGTVSKVSELGTTTSNVTNYAVNIAIDNPTGIKVGMNGNINITVASKSNVVTLSLDAVQTVNGKKYVLTSIPAATSGGSTSSSTSSKRTTSGSSSSSTKGSSSTSTRNYSASSSSAASGSGGVRSIRNSSMKEVTTGLTNETDVEITSGLKDGDSVYIQLPSVSTSTTSTSTARTSGASGYGGGSGSGFSSGSGAARGGN